MRPSPVLRLCTALCSSMNSLISSKVRTFGSTSMTGFVTPNWAAAARATAWAVRPTESLITWIVGNSVELP